MNSPELFVRNPHSILLALRHRPKDVLEIRQPRDASDGAWTEIEALALKHRVKMTAAQGGGGPSGAGRESGHGAKIRPKAPVSVERLFEGVDSDTRGVWLALDCLQDPQNVGAIFRSAAFFGVKGVLLTTERSAPMTAVTYDISCGGVEVLPFAQVVNLKQALDKAKDAGLWILGTSEHAREPLGRIQKDRAWLVVVGNEEKGMRRLTEESCDLICTIPNAGTGVGSLNVSVATGILLGHFSG